MPPAVRIPLLACLMLLFAQSVAGSPLRKMTRRPAQGDAVQLSAPAPFVLPESLAALRRQGEQLIRDQRIEEAIGMYRRVANGSPNDIGAMIRLADLYSWKGDYDRAIALYKDAVERDTVNLVGLKGLARVMRWATRYGEAERCYEKILLREPHDIDALKGMAQTLAQQRRLEQALSIIRRAEDFAPMNTDMLLTKGDILAWGNHFSAAEDCYNEALKLNPLLPEAYRCLGDLFGWMGRPAAGAEMLRKAHSLDPENPDILIKLGNLSIDAGQFSGAEDAVKLLFAIDPNNTFGYEILRRIEQRQSIDYAAFVDNYAKPVFLILSNLVIGLYFHGRKDTLQLRGGPYWRIAYYVWPALALLWLVIFVVANVSGMITVIGFTEVAELATLLAWMFAFVTLVWTTRVSRAESKRAVLAIGAHPDDIELGCGGTLSRYKDLGYRVYGMVMTSGEAGKGHANGHRDRKKEATAGAGILGLDDVWVCDFTDTALADQVNEMKQVIEEKIKQTGAGIIVTQSPFDIHQDHKAVFEATRIAARGDKSLLCYEDVSTESHFAANFFVDITGTIADKVRAVQAHRTQRDKLYMSPKQITGRASHRGLQTGVKYAEAFLLYKGVDL
jgi:LmbE family N-acetylglucosaminyl deacetylase/tetratricopeptide (TPR) repeat protein